MISTDKSNTININQDTYGTLSLIKNQILGKFKRLMDASEARTVYQIRPHKTLPADRKYFRNTEISTDHLTVENK